MTGAAAIAVALALAGGVGFLVIRRRRSSSPGSHI
jgi:LPXTG-motif cell wall-anchored protein